METVIIYTVIGLIMAWFPFILLSFLPDGRHGQRFGGWLLSYKEEVRLAGICESFLFVGRLEELPGSI